MTLKSQSRFSPIKTSTSLAGLGRKGPFGIAAPFPRHYNPIEAWYTARTFEKVLYYSSSSVHTAPRYSRERELRIQRERLKSSILAQARKGDLDELTWLLDSPDAAGLELQSNNPLAA